MRATLLVLAILAAGLFWLARACQMEGPPTDASIGASAQPGSNPAIFSARDAREWLEEPEKCIQAAIRK